MIRPFAQLIEEAVIWSQKQNKKESIKRICEMENSTSTIFHFIQKFMVKLKPDLSFDRNQGQKFYDEILHPFQVPNLLRTFHTRYDTYLEPECGRTLARTCHFSRCPNIIHYTPPTIGKTGFEICFKIMLLQFLFISTAMLKVRNMSILCICAFQTSQD
jgi:hypothetical protein